MCDARVRTVRGLLKLALCKGSPKREGCPFSGAQFLEAARNAIDARSTSMPRLGRRDALQSDVLKGANRLRNAVAAARGEASREILLAELEAILKREIAAEKKTPIPCRRKRKREVLRFSWAPCEKLRGLREVAEALGCGAKWTSLDDGRNGLLKAVRKLRASSETVERAPEGIRIAYLPDPVKSQGAPPERYAAAVLESLGERRVAEVCALTPDDVIRGKLTTDKFDVLLIPGGFAQNTLDALGKAGGERVRAFVRSGGGYVGICAGAYLGCKGWLDVLPEASVVDFEHWSCAVWKSTSTSRRWRGGRRDDSARSVTFLISTQVPRPERRLRAQASGAI